MFLTFEPLTWPKGMPICGQEICGHDEFGLIE